MNIDHELEPRKRHFKVLLWNNLYIDETRLHKGMHIVIKPTLYDSSETKENLIRKYTVLFRITGASEYDDGLQAFMSNLMLCELVEIELKET